MGNFYTDFIMKDGRFKNPNRVADPNLLEPVTRGLVGAIIDAAKRRGIALMIFETYRSEERQLALFNQGATKLKTVGVHHYGLACDLVKNINGEPSWKGSFDFLGELAHENGLIWGGDWGDPGGAHTFIDADHVQRCSLVRQSGLFAGTWYPEDSYDPYKDRRVA
jgi:D-alanyl-D-alanine carboxypeptidase